MTSTSTGPIQFADEIRAALESGQPARAVAQTLIVPESDVLAVQQQMRQGRPVVTAPTTRDTGGGARPAPLRGVPATPAVAPRVGPSATGVNGTVAPDATTATAVGRDDLLTRADATGDKRIAAAAERVRKHLADLAQLVNTWESRVAERERVAKEKAAAKAEVERLERQLREAKARLGRQSSAKPAQPTDDVDAKVVRAWARENDIDVPNAGRVPQRVVEAWRKANA